MIGAILTAEGPPIYLSPAFMAPGVRATPRVAGEFSVRLEDRFIVFLAGADWLIARCSDIDDPFGSG